MLKVQAVLEWWLDHGRAVLVPWDCKYAVRFGRSKVFAVDVCPMPVLEIPALELGLPHAGLEGFS